MVVSDDLQRSRLTVFFRLLLALPHLIWLCALVVHGALPDRADCVDPHARARHAARGRCGTSSAALVRYTTHVYAYVFLAGNPFPGLRRQGRQLSDRPRDRPARAPEPVEDRLPDGAGAARALSRHHPARLSGAPVRLRRGDGRGLRVLRRLGRLGSRSAFLAWFACLVLGRMPTGFRDLLAYALRYGAQTWGYLLFLTDRYPDADPSEPPPTPADHRRSRSRLRIEGDLRRSRLTVFFRLLLTMPHFVWLAALGRSWSSSCSSSAGSRRSSRAGFRSLAPLPRCVGSATDPRLRLSDSRRQSVSGFHRTAGELSGRRARSTRVSASIGWKTLFRLFLAIRRTCSPAALGGVALDSWPSSAGSSASSSAACRVASAISAPSPPLQAQATAYLCLLTDSYPYSGPDRRGRRRSARGRVEGPAVMARPAATAVALVVVALAAVWAVAAWWLWQTRSLAAFDLPDVAASRRAPAACSSTRRATSSASSAGATSPPPSCSSPPSPSTPATACASRRSLRPAASARGCSSACSASPSSGSSRFRSGSSTSGGSAATTSPSSATSTGSS